jgi:hypothetical protein
VSAYSKLWLSILVLSGLTLLFWQTALRYDLLRDGKPATEGGRPSFSLSRAQLLFWTFSVLGAFLLTLIQNGYPDPPTSQIIPNQVLILMGISTGTSFGSSLLDSSNGNQTDATGSFWKDILSSDGSIVNLHRFQMVIWTLVSGGIFWVNLFKGGCHRLPEFDNGLLALMGISGTTFLGLKAQE